MFSSEIVRAEKPGDPKDDIFSGRHAGHPHPDRRPRAENTTRAGDPNISPAAHQLSDRGIRGNSPGRPPASPEPEHRYAQPAAMADALFDTASAGPADPHRGIGLAMVFVCVPEPVGWWRYEQLRQDAAFRDYDLLQQQVEDLPYAEHEAVAQRLQQAGELRKRGRAVRRRTAGRGPGYAATGDATSPASPRINPRARPLPAAARSPGNPLERDAVGQPVAGHRPAADRIGPPVPGYHRPAR